MAENVHAIPNGRPHLGMIQIRPWREISVLALISLELSWIFAWYVFVAGPQDGSKGSWGYLFLGLMMTGAYLLARTIFLLKINLRIRRLLLFLGYLASTALLLQALRPPEAMMDLRSLFLRLEASLRDTRTVLPVELLQVLLATYLWYRAVSFARSRLDPQVALRNFGLGASMLILLGFTIALRGVSSPPVHFAVFAVSGLIALGAARMSSLHRMRGGRKIQFSANWILAILFSSLLVTILTMALGGLAAGGPARWVSVVIQWLINLVLLVAVILVTPIFLLALLIGSWLESSSLFEDVGRELSHFINLMTGLLRDLDASLRGKLDLQLDLWVLKPWLVGAILFVLAGIAFWWFGRQWRLPWKSPEEGIDESGVSERGKVAGRIPHALQDGLGQLADQVHRLRPGKGLLAALRIRRLYARLMRLCRELDSPRSSSETPLEFLPTLRQLFPQAEEETRLMTEAYNRVRYGERPETRAEVEQVERAWTTIRQQAGRLRQAQKQYQARAKKDF
jgi:hypothetical protein